ncbi:MAG TPA: PDZ domain-containing protein [Thermoanaerobaculaceae bacterium]|nr:PDZ domain-containing protein [Thermoanaerobaculaceae bacterium]HRS17663.1 PDZ domain-containing protein [Thermoanaerobaculaceae bacterium]
MRKLTLVFALCTALAASAATAAIDARLLRCPAVSATQIAFVYAGDIWLVPKEGGIAHRLSTPPGEESFPRFSPDGTQLAFSANYDGNLDVYVVPASGGVPTRITHHPDPDRMLAWYPDGASILFASPREAGKDRFNQLFKVSSTGGLPTRLPVPYGEFGAISPDGGFLAYMPQSRDFRTWKRYRGGWAPELWLFDFKTGNARNMTNSPANDGHPMWHGSTIYFLSDRDEHKRNNIWAFDLLTQTTRQVTRFTEYDVRFPSIGPADIVLEAGGRLWRLELGTETLTEVRVEVVTDRATLKPREVNAARLIRNAAVSPSGKRAVFEARGELFSVPAEKGVVFDMTRTSGSAERYPSWSPDGKSVAYFSDESGEYELYVRPADGTGKPRKVTTLGPGFRYRPFWSPDSRRVVFVDQAMRINLCEIDTGKVTVVDKGLWWFEEDLQKFAPSWSADSRWLAYGKEVENRNAAVFLHDTKSGTTTQVTSDFYWTGAPVFDPGGKYLYVLTNRSFTPSYSDLDNSFIYANTTQVAAISLRRDVPSPLAPRNDVESGEKKDDKKDDRADARGKNAKAGKKDTDSSGSEPPRPVEIDLAGLEERLVVLPPKPGNYDTLAAVSGKVLYRRMPRTGSGDEARPLVYFDLEEREEKTVLADVDHFELTADGTKALVRLKKDWAVIDLKPDQKLEKKLPTGELLMTVDARAEWRQIFADAWRLERDYFYDPKLHGVDWNAMRERYGKLLDDCVTRWDVNFVIGELIGELNASHAYRGGGDTEQPLEAGVGLLGVDFALENGAYRIARILRAAPYEVDGRSPLAEPGVEVKEGDYLLAVNRRPLDPARDPYAAFAGLAGKTVLLTVNSKPSFEGAREVLVQTLEDEYRLRNLAWIEANRQRVERLSGGRIGYIYVPDTGIEGQTELVRQFRGQFTKEGLIIDERFNSGGQIPDRFVELLNRPLYNFWGVRDGRDWQWPPVAHSGPKAMLINGWSGSGGDCFPFYFKQAGLGPLVGMRTWGGLIGISGAPGLIDGGSVTVPTFGIYSTDGQWIIEGHGVEPDVEVVDDPGLMAKGGDPQLEKAVELVMAELAKHPPARPTRAPYPDRSR